MDVAWPKLGGQAVAVLVEDEEGMVADGLEVAVVGRLLLRAVDRTLRAVDIERHAAGARPGGIVLHEVRIEAREPLIVPLFSEDIGFEPVERRGERDLEQPPLPRTIIPALSHPSCKT